MTLRLAAEHADKTNWQVGLDQFVHKSKVLAEHCATFGRDPGEIATSAHLRFNPDDPAFLYHDPNAPGQDFAQWNVAFPGFPRAWDFARGDGGEVAVLDSGVYVDHPDLSGRISGALNCAGLTCIGTDVTDTNGHGTHVAGLACADSNSGFGLASGGFDCSIYAIKTDLNLAYLSIINSIYAAADHGADAINMSFGGGGPDTDLHEAIDYAWDRGSIPVVAGANEPTPSAPVNYPAQYVQPEGTGQNVDFGRGLVVTSAKHSGTRSAFAQKTSGVSVAAYGSATDAVSGSLTPTNDAPDVDRAVLGGGLGRGRVDGSAQRLVRQRARDQRDERRRPHRARRRECSLPPRRTISSP